MKMRDVFRSAWSSCPYTMLGRKAIAYTRDDRRKGLQPATDLEKSLGEKIRLGRNIALIGFFCPFFWMALFTGARGQTLYFNAIHSGAVMAIGVGIATVYRAKRVRLRQQLRLCNGGDAQNRPRQKTTSIR